MKKFFYFFCSLFPVLLGIALGRKKTELLRGLENITPEEISAASSEAWKSGGLFVLRGKEIRVPFRAGNYGPPELFLISSPADWKTRQWEKEARNSLRQFLAKDPQDAARQRAYLLGAYGIYCPGY